ncbi:hypothetical protein QUA62_01600 [Microcoleus sp. MON1_C1]
MIEGEAFCDRALASCKIP